MFATISKNSTI